MEKTLYKAGTAIATAALILGSISPFALADTTVEISGNGADSQNEANVGVSQSTGVFQTNDATITNMVSVSTNSGDNKANKNTGGDVSIDTGNASANVSVENTANKNVADVSCGGCPQDTTVTISDNGSQSKNEANVGVESKTVVDQDNTAQVKNMVMVDANTGGNKAKKNTNGNVQIETGDASADVTLSNKVNKNVASVGGGDNESLTVEISGNGADSKNEANVGLESGVGIFQTNDANILNMVMVGANSGDNKANKNTGGDVSIDTGDAEVDVEISNLANFNAADVDGCCLVDLSVKIKDNGSQSKNEANVGIGSALAVVQENIYKCGGHHGPHGMGTCALVEVQSDTGNNKANKNTGEGEPAIDTGDAGADVSVSNQANVNVYGSVDLPIDWPDWPDLPDWPSSWSGLVLLLLAIFS
jgi:hypothetical protein